MQLNEKDKLRLDELLNSLSSKFKLKHIPMKEPTQSLYRFGFFEIYGKRYFISTWNFITKVVTFEDEEGNKVKYDIDNKRVMTGEFKKEKFFKRIKNEIKYFIINILEKILQKLKG